MGNEIKQHPCFGIRFRGSTKIVEHHHAAFVQPVYLRQQA
jgi:hypothetical protein